MWTSRVQVSQLQSKARWKVDFYAAEDGSIQSVYRTIPLVHLFSERREFLNPQEFPDHTFNYISLEHVAPLTGDLVAYEPRVGKEILSRSKVFRKGDILYGRLRPYLNKVFLATECLSEGICSGEFYVLVPDVNQIDPCLARTILASRFVQDVVAQLSTGSTLPRLQLEDLLAVQVPLPPKAEQTGIVQFIEQQDRRRKTIQSELECLPRATTNAVVQFLETGDPVDPVEESVLYQPAEYNHPLPAFRRAPKRRERRFQFD